MSNQRKRKTLQARILFAHPSPRTPWSCQSVSVVDAAHIQKKVGPRTEKSRRSVGHSERCMRLTTKVAWLDLTVMTSRETEDRAARALTHASFTLMHVDRTQHPKVGNDDQQSEWSGGDGWIRPTAYGRAWESRRMRACVAKSLLYTLGCRHTRRQLCMPAWSRGNSSNIRQGNGVGTTFRDCP